VNERVCRSLIARYDRAEAIKRTIDANTALDAATRQAQMREVDDTHTTAGERATLVQFDAHTRATSVVLYNLDRCLIVTQFYWHQHLLEMAEQRRAEVPTRGRRVQATTANDESGGNGEVAAASGSSLLARWWGE
jgi:hypothetical protein